MSTYNITLNFNHTQESTYQNQTKPVLKKVKPVLKRVEEESDEDLLAGCTPFSS